MLPLIDMPRVQEFVAFWRAQAATPPWLHAVCHGLEGHSTHGHSTPATSTHRHSSDGTLSDGTSSDATLSAPATSRTCTTNLTVADDDGNGSGGNGGSGASTGGGVLAKRAGGMLGGRLALKRFKTANPWLREESAPGVCVCVCVCVESAPGVCVCVFVCVYVCMFVCMYTYIICIYIQGSPASFSGLLRLLLREGLARRSVTCQTCRIGAPTHHRAPRPKTTNLQEQRAEDSGRLCGFTSTKVQILTGLLVQKYKY